MFRALRRLVLFRRGTHLYMSSSRVWGFYRAGGEEVLTESTRRAMTGLGTQVLFPFISGIETLDKVCARVFVYCIYELRLHC